MLGEIINNPSWIIPLTLVSLIVIVSIINFFRQLFFIHNIVFPHAEIIKHALRVCMIEKLVLTNDIKQAIKNIHLEQRISDMLKQAQAAQLSNRDVVNALNAYTENENFSWDGNDKGIVLYTPNGTIEFIVS